MNGYALLCCGTFPIDIKRFPQFYLDIHPFFYSKRILKIKMTAVHEQVLKELCFICGCILRGTVYDVDKFKENLENAFNFNFDIVTGVTPMCFFAILAIAFEVECF